MIWVSLIKKKVINATENNPILNVPIVPTIVFKKLGMTLILSIRSYCLISSMMFIPFDKKKSLLWFSKSWTVSSSCYKFNKERFYPCFTSKGTKRLTSPINIKRKSAIVVITANAFGNLNFRFRTNFMGLPIKASIEAMAM